MLVWVDEVKGIGVSRDVVPLRIGIMGGTFDPIHYGHLALGSAAAEDLGLDRVLFVPTGKPWQKAHSVVSEPHHRWEMTRRAVEADERFSISPVDIDRTGPTYAIDTVADVENEYPGPISVFFIVGADTLENLSTWHRVDDLCSRVTFVAVNRPGHSRSSAEIPSSATVTSVDMPGIDVSSTDCRNRIKDGRTIRYFTPDSVMEYIDQKMLYRE